MHNNSRRNTGQCNSIMHGDGRRQGGVCESEALEQRRQNVQPEMELSSCATLISQRNFKKGGVRGEEGMGWEGLCHTEGGT